MQQIICLTNYQHNIFQRYMCKVRPGNTCEHYIVCHRHPHRCNSLPEGDSEVPQLTSIRMRAVWQKQRNSTCKFGYKARNIKSENMYLACIPRVWVNKQATLICVDGKRNAPRISMQHTCKSRVHKIAGHVQT